MENDVCIHDEKAHVAYGDPYAPTFAPFIDIETKKPNWLLQDWVCTECGMIHRTAVDVEEDK